MSKAEIVVLGFLNECPMHGYELISEIKQHGMDQWAQVKQAAVYKALGRLSDKAYIEGKLIQEGNYPARTVYSVTPTGLNYFVTLVHNFLEKFSPRPWDFWLVLTFSCGAVEKEFLRKVVLKRLEKVNEKIQDLMNEKNTENKNSTSLFFGHRILMESGIKHNLVEVESLTKLLEDIDIPTNEKYFIQEEV